MGADVYLLPVLAGMKAKLEVVAVGAAAREERDFERLPLLGDGRLAVAEVAFLLGYEDPSAFHRAFRRWSGRSPRVFRRASG